MVEKFNVLLVDDSPDKLAILKVALQMDGYEVRTAQDGIEALEAVETFPPDLIITDVMMPRMDGYELARRVRANSSTRFIPIIIQTAARGSDRDARRGAEVGALGYITDPTDLDLLRARARTLIDFKDYLNTCEEQAFTDHLTGLANRRRFERQLEREMARSLRYEHPFCLLLLDLDNFKQVNDRFGHQLGDEALSMLAKTLQAETRGIDLAARIGGEEFAVLLTETGYEGGVEVAERLRESIKQVSVPGVGHVTASFGVAEFPTCAGSASDLIECADAALYEAKRQGRDRVARAAALTANQG
ncbi:MAG: hypothetical protein AUG51_22870 [Acidobacteria bacterium 13_1_20CM_3_53_8]|nr:MAG: hypothetical protein AUG51_22870 [Acidobacteria bacterium 13_1_20CM_3_53_8]